MPGNRADDWEKPRSRQVHFTDKEKKLIRQRFTEGKSASDTARELQASSRTIQWHFTLLKSEGVNRGVNIQRKPADYAARLYKPVSWDL
jgi:hypothetical protein